MTGCTELAPSPDSSSGATLAPLLHQNLPNVIPDEYVVVFKPNTTPASIMATHRLAAQLGGRIKHVYREVLTGFSGTLPIHAVKALRVQPGVASISSALSASVQAVRDLSNPPPTPPYPGWSPPNWPPNEWPRGIDRTSERFLPLDHRYTYSESGDDVHVYVIDTGIHANHEEFHILPTRTPTRVSGGTNTVSSSGPTDDCSLDGHGTHMAGTIGGNTVGIAKNVMLHPVRASNCAGPHAHPDYIAAIEWVTQDVRSKRLAGLTGKTVVNLSIGWDTIVPNINNAITASLNALENPLDLTSARLDIIYVVAAGNRTTDACTWSPASINANVLPANRIPGLFVVGAVNPQRAGTPPRDDSRWIDPTNPNRGSNFGACLDFFAPGQDILSADKSSNTAYRLLSGTSSATAHVTGVVARYLQTHPTATPTQLREALHLANNVQGTTTGWGGVDNPGTGSPNELLHYGSRNNGQNDGDPHITTVNNIYYHFQVPGEFVALRDANGMQIQTRQTPVPGAEHVSVNTAVAAQVGQHHVTWQPSHGPDPNRCFPADPHQLELRIDRLCTAIPANGLDLGNGGYIVKSEDGKKIEVTFPDESRLVVTAHWWPMHSRWYLNLSVFHTIATEGIMGAIEDRSWEQPGFLQQWRVSDTTSLFYYPTGISTATFTLPSRVAPPPSPEREALATRECAVLEDRNLMASCQFDVRETGDRIFAESARAQQLIRYGATHTTVAISRPVSRVGEEIAVTATVRLQNGDTQIPSGNILFLVDGKVWADAVPLDARGQARKELSKLPVGRHRIITKFLPDTIRFFLPSSSVETSHTVTRTEIRDHDMAPSLPTR